MSLLYWLAQLPSTDPAFDSLHRLEQFSTGPEYRLLEIAHRQAFLDASWGHSLTVLEARAAERQDYAESQADRVNWPEDESAAGRDALEAKGYALGVTAVRVALREHSQDDMAGAA